MLVKVCDRCGAANCIFPLINNNVYDEKYSSVIDCDFYETDIGLLCSSCNVLYSKLKKMFLGGVI